MPNKIDQAALYKTQISLTEWFEQINHQDAEKLRLEDNQKRDRLSILNKVIGLPFDNPTRFQATELVKQSELFAKFLKEHQKDLYALRLNPINPKDPKFRIRGLNVEGCLKWFSDQKVDPQKYVAEFIPHGDEQKWSTTFIVNQKGIFGEIIKGGHYQLTQGFHDSGKPISFFYDFKKFKIDTSSTEIKKYLKSVLKLIQVTDKNKQKQLANKLDSQFINDYLVGYFETVDTEEYGLWFIDYNRILPHSYSDIATPSNKTKNPLKAIKGNSGSTGKVKGKVKIILSTQIQETEFNEGEILVCEMTTPNHLPLMKKASAIITDMGGILSHAAIVSRELKIPCITATKNATQILKDGDLIEVDAFLGTITKL